MGIISSFGGDSTIQTGATVKSTSLQTSGPYNGWLFITGGVTFGDAAETDYTVGAFANYLDLLTLDAYGKAPTQSGYIPTYTRLVTGTDLGFTDVFKDVTMNGSAYLSASTVLVSPTNLSAIDTARSQFEAILTGYDGPLARFTTTYHYYDSYNTLFESPYPIGTYFYMGGYY